MIEDTVNGHDHGDGTTSADPYTFSTMLVARLRHTIADRVMSSMIKETRHRGVAIGLLTDDDGMSIAAAEQLLDSADFVSHDGPILAQAMRRGLDDVFPLKPGADSRLQMRVAVSTRLAELLRENPVPF